MNTVVSDASKIAWTVIFEVSQIFASLLHKRNVIFVRPYLQTR